MNCTTIFLQLKFNKIKLVQGGEKLLSRWFLDLAVQEYEQKIKRQANPEYMRANSQWLDAKYDKFLKNIKVVYTLLVCSLFFWLLVIIISIVSLFV